MALQEGYQFFVYVSDGSRRYGYATKNGQIKIQKKSYPVSDLVGQPYGTVFEVKGHHLIPVKEPLMPVDEADVEEEGEKDNRDLVDNVDNQTLKQDDILRMRKEGASGKEILEELQAGSTTFDQKTDFSKKKYLRKKAEKYILRCMLVEANSQTVCEQQFMKNPIKMNYMRFDTLAYMLSIGNVHSGQKVMVYDDCMGIVVASVMERLGGYGLVFAVNKQQNRIPCYDCVNRLNFNVANDQNTYIIDEDESNPLQTPEIPSRPLQPSDYDRNIKNTLLIWHMSDLLQIQPQDHVNTPLEHPEPVPLPIPVPAPATVHIPSALYHTETGLKMKRRDGSEMTASERISVVKKRFERMLKERAQPSLEQQRRMLQQGVESLIVASNNPLIDVPEMLPYLMPSGILVVYSQYQTLLAELFAGLKRSGQWINIGMSENFMRKYQVLPKRTHPYMNMYNNGGYVLTATRVLNTTGVNSGKDKDGIRTGASVASTLRKKKLKLF